MLNTQVDSLTRRTLELHTPGRLGLQQDQALDGAPVIATDTAAGTP